MIAYEISKILNQSGPYLIAVFCVVVGILLDRGYWILRIYRYADREIVKTLEYQKNKIKQLEKEIVDLKEINSDLRGFLKIARKSALRIIGAVEG